MKRTAVHGPAFSARPAPTSKYVHQRHATVRKPKTAPTADENFQSLSATPKATATTDSPKTIIVNSAKRSGIWLACIGTRPTRRRALSRSRRHRARDACRHRVRWATRAASSWWPPKRTVPCRSPPPSRGRGEPWRPSRGRLARIRHAHSSVVVLPTRFPYETYDSVHDATRRDPTHPDTALYTPTVRPTRRRASAASLAEWVVVL